MALKGSHLVAIAILAGIGGWMFTGDLILGGQADPDAKSIAVREAESAAKVFRVNVTKIAPSERKSDLEIRGRTEASARVTVRAETGGTVENAGFTKGAYVEAGDLLCTIDEGIRDTSMAQAKATLEQAQADYDATAQLVKRRYATKSRLRQLQTALDAAKATVAQATQEMNRTRIVATVNGIIGEPFAETGDNLAPGGVCATLLQTRPMMFSGQVPEARISALSIGMDATVTLVTGEEVEGKIAFIAAVADATTRTFEIEIELPNEDRSLRDGLTATASIGLEPTTAYLLQGNWLTLDANGRIGVRIVGDENTVAFAPVRIIAEETDGIWVDGLRPDMQIITLGQNFVDVGTKVEPVFANGSASDPATPTSALPAEPASAESDAS